MILTIGHSTHEAAEFAGLLAANGVELLIDVRRHPGSRRVPWTNPGAIEAALPVPYVHLPELGGRRRPRQDSPNGFWRNSSFRGYADHMAGDEFAAGLERLLALAIRRRVAIMCAEAQWWRCHRRLVADALVARDCPALHVDSAGRAEPHRLTDAAVITEGLVQYPPPQIGLLADGGAHEEASA
jgi:uncharacterized protein (DUF488 family)